MGNTEYFKNSAGAIARSLHTVFLVALISACTPGDGGGFSDSGDQNDSLPVAKASIVNFQIDEQSGLIPVRAGTHVIVTAKDSDGIDDPILSFNWTAMQGNQPIAFTQDISSAIAFMAPTSGLNTKGVEDVEVTLNVVDSDGITSTTSLSLDVLAILDTNNYLVQNTEGVSVEESFILEITNTDPTNPQAFTLEITPRVDWLKANNMVFATGDPSTTPDPFVNIFSFEPISATVPAGGTYKIKLPIPLVDADEINAMPGRSREDRLELENIDTETTLSLSFDITGPFNLKIPSSLLPSEPITDFSEPIDIEDIRVRSQLESVASATAYYNCVDIGMPNGSATLENWLNDRDFGEFRSVQNAENFAHAVYVNNYDLGFGRDMYMRKDGDNVYSYVVNHPNLQSTVNGTDAFAVVAMDFSESRNCTNGALEDPVKRIVKFYAFVEDTKSGGFKRATTMNFDGRGERSIPGACTSCHGGSASELGFSTSVDLDATFMPWDLDSFLYTSASSQLPDPGYNAVNANATLTALYTREAQEEEFRKLNQITLSTYISKVTEDPTQLLRYQAPIELINGWYGNSECDVAGNASTDNCDTINGVFDSTFTQGQYTEPDGSWDDEGDNENLYHQVYARNCRMCHTQLVDTDLNFDEYSELDAVSASLNTLVYQQGRMPLARLTADRFWLDKVNANETAADILRAHGFSNPVDPDAVPGQPIAAINIGLSGQPIHDQEIIEFDALNSLFAETFSWNLEYTNPDDPITDMCSSTFIANNSVQNGTAAASRITFNIDGGSTPGVPGEDCELDLKLSVDNSISTLPDKASIRLRLQDRVPTASNLSIAANSNQTIDIPVVADLIVLGAPRGDDEGLAPDQTALEIVSTPASGTVTNNNNGTLTYQPLASIAVTTYMDSFQYRVQDLNGTYSSNGTITINNTAAMPGTLSVVNESDKEIGATQLNLSWGAATAPMGTSILGYKLYIRDHNDGNYMAISGDSTDTNTTTFEDTNLTSDTSYDYEVAVVLSTGESPSRSENNTGVKTPLSYINNVKVIFSACHACHDDDGAEASASAYDVFNLSGDDNSDWAAIRVEIMSDNIPCKPSGGVGCGGHTGGGVFLFGPGESNREVFDDWVSDGEYR